MLGNRNCVPHVSDASMFCHAKLCRCFLGNNCVASIPFIPFGSSDILCQHSFVDLIIINAKHIKLLGVAMRLFVK